MDVPRCLHFLWARLCGYFWLPCPLCHAMFGGHEVIGRITTRRMKPHLDARHRHIPDNLVVCPRCEIEWTKWLPFVEDTPENPAEVSEKKP